ncbi:signal peptidase I [Candidatus Woesearchaeota archaeon]|nr:signal peptidase I [Candidatus Woesearchaeota archaeon]
MVKKPSKLHKKSTSKDNSKVKSIKSAFARLKYLVFEDESIYGWIAAFFVMFIALKFLILPVVGFALNTDYPIVAVISGSMEHRLDSSKMVCGKYPANYNTKFETWWNTCGYYYENNYNFTESEFSKFSQKNGFNIGDVMILHGTKPENLKLGDIIVFDGGRSKPIIHRIVKIQNNTGEYIFTTKGDHNPESYPFEAKISEDDYLGKAILKIPLVGYVKILFINLLNAILGIFGFKLG